MGMPGQRLFVCASREREDIEMDVDGRAGERGSMIDALRDVSSSRRWLGLSRWVAPARDIRAPLSRTSLGFGWMMTAANAD
ncbi:hypothetical protein BST61_g4967 [Cercospora zeina]